jgi:hypothetical protein
MTLKEFLAASERPSFWGSRQTLCFTGSEYPAAFFSAIFDRLRAGNLFPHGYQRIDIAGREKREIYGTLGQSVLGSQTFFWLGNVSDERESKAATAFKQYLCDYQFPHSVAFFIATTDVPAQNNATIIQLPAVLDLQEFILLGIWLGQQDIEKKKSLYEELFYTGKQSLQSCILLYDYVALASTKQKALFSSYIQVLYASDITLQQLAESFFSKREKEFFITWDKLQDEYPPIFWVIFWTEQLWRALHVTKFMHQKQFVNAKKMSYRLPYSFINKDWQRVQIDELVECYEFLYQIDYAIKTGSTFCSLDLFFAHYFAGIFAKKAQYDFI